MDASLIHAMTLITTPQELRNLADDLERVVKEQAPSVYWGDKVPRVLLTVTQGQVIHVCSSSQYVEEVKQQCLQEVAARSK